MIEVTSKNKKIKIEINATKTMLPGAHANEDLFEVISELDALGMFKPSLRERYASTQQTVPLLDSVKTLDLLRELTRRISRRGVNLNNPISLTFWAGLTAWCGGPDGIRDEYAYGPSDAADFIDEV